MKNISKIIKEFETLPFKGYVQQNPNHEPTDSYFYLSRYLSKCMMRADSLHLYVDPVIMKITGMQHIPILHICNLNKRK